MKEKTMRSLTWTAVFVFLITFWVILLMMVAASVSHSADDVIVQTLCDLNDSNLGCIFTHYKVGDTDTLVAEPEPGYYFAGWGGICTGRGECTFTITKEGQRLDLTARFEKIPDKPRNLRRVK
jgi:uncharacterized repeat protein (TIGR02543 family)